MDRPCGNCGEITDSERGYHVYVGGGDYQFKPVCAVCLAKDAETWRKDGKCPIGLGRLHCLSCAFQSEGDCHFEQIAEAKAGLEKAHG